jgi:hypothetical protein
MDYKIEEDLEPSYFLEDLHYICACGMLGIPLLNYRD